MSLMLPAAGAAAWSLTGVASDLLRSLTGEEGSLRPARSAVLVVIDGLGAVQLRAHAGHARRLGSLMGKSDRARTVFPTTTAVALSSLMTGAWPGEHGLVGYQVRDPAQGILVNQLSGWERSGVDPYTWQPMPTVFERAAERGLHPYAVGRAEYRSSGFTRAVLRGAEYVGEDDPSARVAKAYDIAGAREGSLVYCYLPELDKAGHGEGVASDAWIAALETADASFPSRVPAGVGVVATADHGMVDVPRHRHILLAEGDPRLEGVAQIGGEPRMLHLYAQPGTGADEIAERWRETTGRAADVTTRAEALAAGLFGPRVTADARERVGDVLVAARGVTAFYDDRLTDKRAQSMIGQHGSLTPEETVVPFLRMGEFAS